MSARKPPASAPITCGASQINSATTAAITSSARLMIVEATCQNSRSSPSAYSLNTGTSAALIAPLISRSYRVVDGGCGGERVHRCAGAEQAGDHRFTRQPKYTTG